MRILRSEIGLFFSLTYLAAAASAYFDYRRHAGGRLADLMLFLLTLPYNLATSVLTSGSSKYEVRGDQPLTLLVAVLLCAMLVYGLGALCGAFGHWLRILLR